MSNKNTDIENKLRKEHGAVLEDGHRSPILGRLLLGTTLRLRRSRCLKLLREIEGNPFAPASESAAKQMARLSNLLAHAEARVPYYREMFSRLGIHSTDICSLSDFKALPILTKNDIRERERDFLCEGVDSEKLIKGSSGGSTGAPLNFYYDQSVLDASEAATFRNLGQSGWLPGEMIGLLIGFDKKTRQVAPWEFEIRQLVRRMYQFNSFHCSEGEMEWWIKKFKRIGVRVVIGFPSTLARFADYILKSGKRVPMMRGVFSTGEKLFLHQRKTIARAFNCAVFDCYGSSEVRNIATECSHGRMHINTDYVVLETDPTSVQPGEPEPLVLTSLWNYVMPFIRYRNEDYGALVDDVCDCGNTFPLMRLDVGRVSDNFMMPDGKVVHGQFFTHMMYRSEGIANFQFHQTAPDAITLWVVPGYGTSEAREGVIRAAIEQIKTLSSVPIKVEVHEVEAIPPSPAGKHRYTRSDVIPNSTDGR